MTILLALVIAANGLSGAQPTPQEKLETAYQALRSRVPANRSTAFYDLIHLGLATDADSKFPVADGVLALASSNPASRSRLIAALNTLLETETDLGESKSAPNTEEYSDYYGDLILAVTTLRDTSSLHAVLRCINTGGMAQGALASFGDSALAATLRTLPAADDETRNNLYRVWAEMAEPRNQRNLSAESQTSLQNVLLKGVKESDPHNRRIAVSGLAYFTSPEAIQAVQQLAASDPVIVVREAAVEAAKGQEKLLLKKP